MVLELVLILDSQSLKLMSSLLHLIFHLLVKVGMVHAEVRWMAVFNGGLSRADSVGFVGDMKLLEEIRSHLTVRRRIQSGCMYQRKNCPFQCTIRGTQRCLFGFLSGGE